MGRFEMPSKEENKKLDDLQLLREHIILSRSRIHTSTFASKVIIARIDDEILRLRLGAQTQIESMKMRGDKSYSKSASASSGTSTSTSSRPLKVLRIFLVDAPMTILFSIMMLSILIQNYYMHYVSPTIDAANWANDDAARLKDEFTYYHRECDVSDVTADSIESIMLDENKDTYKDAVENLMIHGMTLMPSLVDGETAHNLREYILKRNQQLTNDEAIPLDGPENRWSFGIHANEDPSVASALEQLSTNPLLVKSMETMIGKNPAVAEITAITVAPGAGPQGWHSDVKQLGNSLKYAQTFTHSHSLFLPLQDVTAEMGATELCPGTHYCATADMHDTCVEASFQAAGPGNKNVWKAGDGLVMNQKMWHRGAAYTARRGLYRVVFIVTFISRPDPSVDHRQLSHGTYFHIHPRMYGHTLKDLQTAHISMSEPFASLRSLGIWKPPDSSWGWDWVTSSSVRIANEENGYSTGELFDFVEFHSLAQMVPSWLHGSVLEEGGWQLYIKETIDNFVLFFEIIYCALLVFMFAFVAVVDVLQNFRHWRSVSFIKRVFFVNTTILLVSYLMVTKVQQTQYAKSIENKTIFARPFLSKPEGKDATATIMHMDSNMMDYDLTKPKRPTAIPEKDDILLGNRHDSRHIGYYKNYLNYHPGNKKWRELVATYSSLYNSYSELPPPFREIITHNFEEFSESTGRMLTQNYYGEWLVMNQSDKAIQRRKALLLGTNMLHTSLDQEISILSAEARHSTFKRGSNGLQKETIRYLKRWSNVIAPIPLSEKPKGPKLKKSVLRMSLHEMKPLQSKTQFPRRDLKLGRSVTKVNVGDIILVNYRGSGNWLPARFIVEEYNNYGIVEFFLEERELCHVYLNQTRAFKGIQEGDDVSIMSKKCARCVTKFEEATVTRASPDNTCDVIYGNGDIENRIPKEEIAYR